ncbi:single-stranded DNA-binding protein [Spiractinospora alimapuensis]|uniref:single-stranded DNA-binding protein n=1 Tax=Spiractinospora alimapuensis TaxID=2820884 RepID=UPI001F36CBC3|nr:single-stranded DNA-binding protein [Spiractinospora alimapuensis]QVQ52107.1 single-stranded DNA-binding protein [Spiractinospora alimapuensis]
MTSPTTHRNSVVIAGRITAEPALRELSSGHTLARWRVAVTRPVADQRGRVKTDAVTCVTFDPSIHDSLREWRLGDVVEVSGALRRRFWRAESGPVSTFEVEARSVSWLAAGSTASVKRASRPS